MFRSNLPFSLTALCAHIFRPNDVRGSGVVVVVVAVAARGDDVMSGDDVAVMWLMA